MQSSLGIFIEKNTIKYAKLQKNRDLIQIASYNTKFYDGNNLKESIEKIIEETYCQKTPVCVNVFDEMYNMFYVPSLLKASDAKKAATIEYESFCNQKNLNKMLFDSRSLFVEDNANSENQRVLNVMTAKAQETQISKILADYKMESMSPIPVSVTNLLDPVETEKIVIVNIEEKTYVTTMMDGNVYQINVIEQGMGEILNYINGTENSLSKSYEVCKNLTVYAQDMGDTYSEDSEYVDVVKSKLYEIAEQVKKITEELFTNINKIYITGAGTCINNVDLFFQEFVPTIKCEILKPYFLGDLMTSVPIKEYIENNSAIALALDGLGFANKEMNFVKGAKAAILTGKKSANASKEPLKIDFQTIKTKAIGIGKKIAEDFKKPLNSIEKLMLRGSAACLLIVCIFAIYSSVISGKITEKTAEVDSVLAENNEQLSKIKSDISTISSRTSTYENLIKEMTTPKEEEQPVDEEPSEEDEPTVKQRVITKDSIPNFLNRVMFVIPKKVKLISIKNTTSNHIVISAEAEKYEQLGYFKAVLTTNGILTNVKSNSGEKTGTSVQVTIEGDLP